MIELEVGARYRVVYIQEKRAWESAQKSAKPGDLVALTMMPFDFQGVVEDEFPRYFLMRVSLRNGNSYTTTINKSGDKCLVTKLDQPLRRAS